MVKVRTPYYASHDTADQGLASSVGPAVTRNDELAISKSTSRCHLVSTGNMLADDPQCEVRDEIENDHDDLKERDGRIMDGVESIL